MARNYLRKKIAPLPKRRIGVYKVCIRVFHDLKECCFFVRFKVPTVTNMRSIGSWGLSPCNTAKNYRRLEDSTGVPYPSDLKTEELCSSETSLNFCQTVEHHSDLRIALLAGSHFSCIGVGDAVLLF
jgi:hypothetical protein